MSQDQFDFFKTLNDDGFNCGVNSNMVNNTVNSLNDFDNLLNNLFQVNSSFNVPQVGAPLQTTNNVLNIHNPQINLFGVPANPMLNCIGSNNFGMMNMLNQRNLDFLLLSGLNELLTSTQNNSFNASQSNLVDLLTTLFKNKAEMDKATEVKNNNNSYQSKTIGQNNGGNGSNAIFKIERNLNRKRNRSHSICDEENNHPSNSSSDNQTLPKGKLFKNHKLVFVHSKSVYSKGNTAKYLYDPKSKVNIHTITKPEIVSNPKTANEVVFTHYSNPITDSNTPLVFVGNPNHKSAGKLKPGQMSRGSKFRGVSKNGNLWQVLIMVNKKKRYVGSYFTEEEAARNYDKAAIQFHREKTKTNYYYTAEEIESIRTDPPMLKMDNDDFSSSKEN